MTKPSKHQSTASDEHRCEARQADAGVVFWQRSPDATPEMGWLLETSEGGFAFASRGPEPPREHEVLAVRFAGDRYTDEPLRVTVKRSSVAHSDLSIVAVQRLSTQDARTTPATRQPDLRTAAVAVHAGARKLAA